MEYTSCLLLQGIDVTGGITRDVWECQKKYTVV